jgi:LuxR family maltose regulon positive regulatory protein
LQMLGLSLQGRTDPDALLEALSGSQRYILDYLIDEVLEQQEVSVQTFLLHTSILERLSAPLCDTVLEQSGSQQVLEYLERTNLFISGLDGERRWYRYHQLFAEALRYRLERLEDEQVVALHLRASHWYAEQGFTNEAVQHALQAQAWEHAAELIESLMLQRRGQIADQHGQIRRWLGQFPTEVICSSPRLCYIYALVLCIAAQYDTIDTWLQRAEAGVMSLAPGKQVVDPSLQAERENLLGEILSLRALLAGTRGESESVFSLGQEALTHLPEQNSFARFLVAMANNVAYSSLGDMVMATQSAFTASSLVQAARLPYSLITSLCDAAISLLKQGHLHQTWQILEQAATSAKISSTLFLPIISFVYTIQAQVWYEWDRLDSALDLIRQAIQLSEETGAGVWLPIAYAELARIELGRGNIDAGARAIEQAEQITIPLIDAIHIRNIQIRSWIARGEMERAANWANGYLQRRGLAPLLMQEREDVALVRVLLAQKRSIEALKRLAPLLEQASRQQRWGHVIEMRLLEALAYRMDHQEQAALASLTQAIQLAEPEGYIRSFVEGGPPMAALLTRQRDQQRQYGPTPYLDTLLAAFPQPKPLPSEVTSQNQLLQPLQDPLTEREREVLLYLVQGSTNQEIAERLAITIDTVKRHITHIYSKLRVTNRVQAVKQAHSLALL